MDGCVYAALYAYQNKKGWYEFAILRFLYTKFKNIRIKQIIYLKSKRKPGVLQLSQAVSIDAAVVGICFIHCMLHRWILCN